MSIIKDCKLINEIYSKTGNHIAIFGNHIYSDEERNFISKYLSKEDTLIETLIEKVANYYDYILYIFREEKNKYSGEYFLNYVLVPKDVTKNIIVNGHLSKNIL